MKMKFVSVAFVSILSLVGCAQSSLDYKSGTEIKADQLSKFAPGSTIQGDVIRDVGHPNRKESLNGKELWYYDFSKIGAFGGNISEATVFEWDAQGKLIQAYKAGKAGKTGNALIDAANGNK